MPKRATAVVLSEKEQEELTRITKRHRSEQRLVLRARIVLAAAQGQSNAQIARELDINVDTARLWRDRWVSLQGIDLKTLRLASVNQSGVYLKRRQLAQLYMILATTWYIQAWLQSKRAFDHLLLYYALYALYQLAYLAFTVGRQTQLCDISGCIAPRYESHHPVI